MFCSYRNQIVYEELSQLLVIDLIVKNALSFPEQ
jgi:hypothetical protein